MTDKATLARPYATAVFEIAEKENKYKDWSNELFLLSIVAKQDKVLHLLRNRTLSTEFMADFFIQMVDPYLTLEGKNLIRTLAYQRRLNLLPLIAKLYEKLRAEKEKIIYIKLLSARDIKEDQIKSISEKLETYFQKAVQVDYKIESNLIGGFVVEAGDFVIDNSVKGQLTQLKDVMEK